MVLTREQQFELRAKKALETGDASFKPRGQANKALFEKMKEDLNKKAGAMGQALSNHDEKLDKVLEGITPASRTMSNTYPAAKKARVATLNIPLHTLWQLVYYVANGGILPR